MDKITAKRRRFWAAYKTSLCESIHHLSHNENICNLVSLCSGTIICHRVCWPPFLLGNSQWYLLYKESEILMFSVFHNLTYLVYSEGYTCISYTYSLSEAILSLCWDHSVRSSWTKNDYIIIINSICLPPYEWYMHIISIDCPQLQYLADVSSLSRPYSRVSYYCIITGCEFCFMWCRVWNLSWSSRCWQLKRSCCWEQEGFRMDAGIKKKLNLNPRTNSSSLSRLGGARRTQKQVLC
jgi:hypothetical protein